MTIKVQGPPEESSEMIIQHKLDDVKSNFSHQDYFNNYIINTLDSFGFRYLNEPSRAEVVSNNEFKIKSVELGIKEAIKNKNPELRAGITELVKRVSKAEGPTIISEIRVKLSRDVASSGSCTVMARISFGHPEHDFKKGTYVENVCAFKFDDDIHLRNEISKHLETVCALF